MEQQVQEKKSSGIGKALGIGCLVVVVVVGICGYFVFKNAKKLVLLGGTKVIEATSEGMMSQLQLPQAEKDAAMAPIRRFCQDVRDGKVTMEQAKRLMESLATGPLPIVLGIRAAEVTYLAPSTLTPEEKTEAHVTLSRFARGTVDKLIPQSKGQEVFNLISTTSKDSSGEDKRELKDSLTDDELRQCLATMKDAADQAGVEDREFPIDIAAEIQKAVDSAMKVGK